MMQADFDDFKICCRVYTPNNAAEAFSSSDLPEKMSKIYHSLVTPIFLFSAKRK